MNEFEKALYAHCQEDSQYEVLWAQWTYDKRLVAQALQAVGVLFPHYSLHDASHSNTILRQLARVLGTSRIARLSPTDLWLLLEAAYHHDIGMVVPDAQKRQWWREPAFRVHLDRLKESSDRDLRSAAALLSSKSLGSLGDDWPFEVQHALLLAVADYARQQHPKMAEQIVLQPALVGLASPRILIPKRAFQLLALICRHHGSSFEKALELPARESGYGTDEAHPRFIACMLRLGDLLDLDDGRFCPVLMSTLKGLPPSSHAHERKHASIRHLLVSTTRIEVEAVCDENDIAAYDETERWFAWLRDELKNQAARWADIVPAEDFGSLPSAGRIAARIEGHTISDDGRLPRFEVDREAMIKLVRGANIYDHPVSFLRELLQNAVDATLLRCWKEHSHEIISWEADEHKRDSVIDLLRGKLKAYPIRVRILYDGPEPTQEAALSGGKCRFKIVIEDQGMGISKGDIHHMQSIGGSRKNQRKQQRRMDVPDWMQPSGIFGIGLQSVFLFSDRIEITTRPDDAPECLKITLHRGEVGSVGQIIVKELGGVSAWGRPGTMLECDIEVPLMPQGFRTQSPRMRGVEEKFFAHFDGVRGTKVPLELVLAQAEVEAFARGSLCPIELDGMASKQESSGVPAGKVSKVGEEQKRYFDRETNVELRLSANLNRTRYAFGDAPSMLLYRGVKVSQERIPGNELFEMKIDLHFGRADELLALSREQIRRDQFALVEEKTAEALLHVFPRYYDDLRAAPAARNEILAASLFAEIEGHRCVPPRKSDGQWRSAEVFESALLGDIVDSDVVEVVTTDLSDVPPEVKRIDSGEREGESVLRLSFGDAMMPSYFWPLLLRTHKAVFVNDRVLSFDDETGEEVLEFVYRFYRAHDRAPGPLAGDESVQSVLRRIGSNRTRGVYSSFRSTMPAAPGFDSLQITKTPVRSLSLHGKLAPRMVCPFSFYGNAIRIVNLVDVVSWTVQNAGNGQVRALKQADMRQAKMLVASEFLRFIEYSNQLMEGKWAAKVAYDMAEVRFVLSKEFGPLKTQVKGAL